MLRDQKKADAFLKELVKELVKKHRKSIDFIILYGSAARGEFIAGVSDIDLVIQLKDAKSVSKIKSDAGELFWKLDKKHKTLFSKVCRTKKSKSLMSKVVKEVEEKVGLYVPVFVFMPDEVDWANGIYIKKGYSAVANVFYPSASVFNKFRIEGKVLYGRDIRKFIKPRITLWERFKAIMVPFWLSWGASIIVGFAPKKAVKNSTKAILYEIEAALFYLDQLKSNKAKREKFEKLPEFNFKVNSIKKFIELDLDVKYNAVNPKYFDIIEEALRYKKEGFKGNRKSARRFVWRAWAFINKMNFIVIIRRILRLL